MCQHEDFPCCGCDPDGVSVHDDDFEYDEECCWADPDGDGEPDESMDGDFDSAMASAGFGTDEDYGYYGGGEEW